jgi:hypothetical protein
MINCANKGWYYPAICTACALPEICAALESDGDGGRSKYKVWFNQYAAKYFDGQLSGHDAYQLRCSVLHQGKIEHDKMIQHTRIGFIEPHSQYNRWGKHYPTNTLLINVLYYCESLGKAVIEWLNVKEQNPDFQANYKKFFQRTTSEDKIDLYDVPILFTTE